MTPTQLFILELLKEGRAWMTSSPAFLVALATFFGGLHMNRPKYMDKIFPKKDEPNV